VTLPVRVSEPASAELREAVRWYEGRRVGLGAEFFDAISTTLLFVSMNATAGSSISGDDRTRRALVARFPYQVVYRIRPGEIVIVAVAHLKRRPGYWKNRAWLSSLPNAAVQPPHAALSSAPHVHNEMTHLRRASDWVSRSAATAC
jgi:plasmid stabilization system protein ParE